MSSVPLSTIAAQLEASPVVAKFLQRSPRLLIAGEWVESASSGCIPVIDPATGKQISAVAAANASDVDRAVCAARAAFERGPWADMLPVERQALLWRLSDLIDKNADELAELESLNNGKTKFMANVIDVPAARDYFRYMAGWATKIEGSTFQTSIHGPPGARFHTYSVREPVGVVAQIVPWNFPLLMAAWKLGPALATGCTCVLKPAEQTPVSALRLGELIIEAGFPPGVVNVLTGNGATTGAQLVAHPGVDKIAFTGSTEVGKLISRAATDTLKRVSLELGGKSPIILFPDVDLNTLIGGAANAIFFNSGQTCTAGSRQIDAHNVSRLKLAWHYDLDTAHRAQESTPLVIDGVMYVTSAWSKVFALDAATGAQLWSCDPKVPGEWGVNACCDVANRRVAAWNGKIFVGSLDGRLIALDAATGEPAWEQLTVDRSFPYTITGAPRVVKGLVIIGNGGAEFGVRGYVSAYDAQTGKMAWRFYTVPRDPSQGFESPALEQAARTWTGEWWKLGGGGTVWDSLVYDPSLDLLYIGTGNGSPWDRKRRSPGGGDNLYLSSIVALRPDTGECVWHYQTTPGESWDFTATQPLMLADLQINGRLRKAIMQLPKNGFFYVLDRATGELISAQPVIATTWASRVDLETGRPVENPAARYGETGKPFVSNPGPMGAHSWMPMAFSPLTKLVYVPVNDAPFLYIPDRNFKPALRGFNNALDSDAGSLPEDEAALARIKSGMKGHLAAWDPVTQKEVWRVQYGHPSNGGALATAGGLVFAGSSMGEIAAYQADDGVKLWSAETQAGVLAAPIAYEVNAEQYVAVEVGWGGAFGLIAGPLALDAHSAGNLPRVLAYKLNGADSLPAAVRAARRVLQPPPDTASAAVVAQGKATYHRYCGVCHGDSAVSGGVLPDLRYSSALGNEGLWNQIVRDGILKAAGMASFAPALSQSEIDAVRAYVVRRASLDAAEEKMRATR